MTFGIKLQKLRKTQGLSQEQLAEKLGISRQAISRWELDETLPDSENVIKLADMFYVSAEYLLNDNITRMPAKTLSVSANRYDTVNLLAALASVAASVMAFIYYILRMLSDYKRYCTLPQRDSCICVYGNRVHYEILDETVILLFLTIVVIISVIVAVKLYKKCKLQVNEK